MVYSFSKIDTYRFCPFKFQKCYIEKVPQVKTDALIKGSEIHEALEHIENLTPDNKHYDIIKRFAECPLGQDVLSKPSVREVEIKLNDKFEAQDDLPRDEAKLIGYIDRVNFADTVELIDFKTGKGKDLKYQDFSQLSIYALYIYTKYRVENIKLRYVYVEAQFENSLMLNYTGIENTRYDLITTIRDIEKSVETQNFPRKFQKLCGWCQFNSICSKFKN